MQTANERLAEFRLSLGFQKKADFAEKVGIERSTYDKMEKGPHKPSADNLEKIAAKYPSVNLNWLLLGQGAMLLTDTAPLPLQQPRPAPLPIAAEPTVPYGCVAPDLVVTLTAEVAELRSENKQLKEDLRQARREAREDLIAQARTYNSVKEDQALLITRLRAKLDEYELRLGYRRPTAEERQQAEQAGSGAPRMEMIPFGARYRNAELVEATECVVREMYPAAVAA